MQFKPPSKNRRISAVTRCLAWTGVFVVSATLIFSFSETAHASLASFVNSLWGSEQASADISQPVAISDLSTTVLPQPATNFDPIFADATDTPPLGDNNDTLDATIASANQTGNDESLNTQITSYVVEPGDTLSGISNIFDISENTIRQANGLSGNTITPGQTLQILPVSGILYTVKSGDSIQKIATTYGASIDDILTYNNLSLNSSLTAGQQLIVPHAKTSSSSSGSSGSRSSGSHKVPAFEPLLDNPSSWPIDTGYYTCPLPLGVDRISQGLHGHNAVDLAAPKYTPIYAAAAGEVIVSRMGGWNGGYGNFVMIQHSNDTETLYAHMFKTLVSVGEEVSQGEQIGSIGMTGLTTGPHLHIEVRGAQNPFLNPAACE